ncbi:hypothetical protein J2795_002649 [Chryseobacterium bernardetii]|uniref:YD repeat-containing protein n=2 Tax=Chryseobacterium TaxID=59732 RepID=A0A543EBE6_9FLAO|nr:MULTISPECIES: hypothetical protein [Chryseobacterium]MDR6371565.1 hypothetical protein [Chryseobacterium vietnamense]MDR6441931.1 hypothetical protein [Chryseobacterium bernardetii]TQM18809.1 hypothetical protein FB551_3202 [Chryseobacterium aquifrigidense]
MKKLLLFGAIALSTLSCSSSDDNPFDNSDPSNQSVILPTKMTMDGIVMKINYNGTKIISMINNINHGQRVEFSYTDDYVSGIKNYENNVLESAVEYGYSNGRMSTAVIKEYSTAGVIQNTVSFNYMYTSNTEISVQKQTNSGTAGSSTINSVFTYSNGNMVSSIGSGTGTVNGNTINYTEKETYTYTDKNYPFKNVKGFDKIIFNGNESSDGISLLFSNIKNSLSTYKGEFTNTTAGGGTATGTTSHKYTTTFNTAGYPSEESRQSLDMNGNANTSAPDKFFYEYNYQ